MSYQILNSVCKASINMPVQELDLSDWIFHMSDKEYQACSKGHIAAGTSIHTDGTQTSVNVETLGGNLLVQHYVPEIAEADHLKLVSQTDLWLFRVWYVRVKVTWELRLAPTSETTCEFQNSVMVEHKSIIMKILSALALGGVFLKLHNREETPLFAENLAHRSTQKVRTKSATDDPSPTEVRSNVNEEA